ncbi:MAG: selenocysteine-specific translation elongation factor [bacterium]
MQHLIIGTAGHIDHGKTSVVKALTGVDTDRLKEEKERGLTIDLGFAHLGDQATIIDVPGHEKFIRNMVAGVSTIDFVLFIVAADDGVMPQTREHLDILKILQIQNGLIVITKIDLVEEDWLTLVKDDIRALVKNSFLEDAPIVPVSTATHDGMAELKSRLETELTKINRKQNQGIFWMPVDRSFTMKGFGTVVTGSVLAGEIKVGSTVEILPHKVVAKIRGLQSHGHTVEKVSAGDRAAINLQALDKRQIHRGDVLAETDYFKPSQRFDARLQLLESAPRALKPRSRVRLHFGTTEVMARVSLMRVSQIAPGETAFVQFHLEETACARRLDPFVIRQYSPTLTIGGGVILDANARRHKMSDPTLLQEMQTLEKENPLEVLERKLFAAEFRLLTLEQLTSEIAASKESLQELLNRLSAEQKLFTLKKAGKIAVLHANNFNKLQSLILESLNLFHQKNPLKLGLPKAELQKRIAAKIDRELFDFTLDELKKEPRIKEQGGVIGLSSHKIELPEEHQKWREKIAARLFEEGFATSSEAELEAKIGAAPDVLSEILNLMISSGEIVRVENSMYFHGHRVEEAKEKLLSFLKKHREITVSQFKDLLGNTSRKYALPLLSYFDAIGITERMEDVRVLRIH